MLYILLIIASLSFGIVIGLYIKSAEIASLKTQNSRLKTELKYKSSRNGQELKTVDLSEKGLLEFVGYKGK